MEKPIKTEETKVIEQKEIKEIKDLRAENTRMTFDFGRIRMDIIMLKAKLMELEKMESDATAKFKGNQTKEAKIVEKLKKKYGDGTINLEKGLFTPVASNGQS
tara:strand:- start:948 stop:1256 length:309 start_codon:yes stop_codon:yes gene_type:complete